MILQSLRLRPMHTLQKHKASRDFIARELRKPKTTRRVVVTHMGPHPSAIRRGFERDISSAAYASDCSDLMALGVDAWIHGHTHYNVDYVMGSTRVLTNQLGYPDERCKGFNPSLVVEI